MTTSTIRPGILVSLKSAVSGGVSYERRDVEKATTASGAIRAKWETEKTVDDPEEHAAATKARSDALALIRKGLIHTAFGLLCPVDQEDALNDRRRQAKAIVEAFNGQSRVTRISVYCLMGRIASTDEEAARAIGAEVADLVSRMNGAIDRLDPEAIREAADKAKAMSAMLGDDQAATIGEAIKQARAAARQIVKRIEKDGETAEVVVKDIQRGALEKARIAFLDLDDSPAVSPGDAMPVASPQRVAALDLDDDARDTIVPPAAESGEIERTEIDRLRDAEERAGEGDPPETIAASAP
jgi:hypothetical protein